MNQPAYRALPHRPRCRGDGGRYPGRKEANGTVRSRAAFWRFHSVKIEPTRGESLATLPSFARFTLAVGNKASSARIQPVAASGRRRPGQMTSDLTAAQSEDRPGTSPSDATALME